MQWLAVYNDDTYLLQYNEDGTPNSYDSIDRSKLSEFHIIDVDENGKHRRVASVFLERPTQQLIWRMRGRIHSGGPRGVWKEQIIMLGWHENIDGRSYKSIMYINEDGTVELAGSRKQIQLKDWEIPDGCAGFPDAETESEK